MLSVPARRSPLFGWLELPVARWRGLIRLAIDRLHPMLALVTERLFVSAFLVLVIPLVLLCRTLFSMPRLTSLGK